MVLTACLIAVAGLVWWLAPKQSKKQSAIPRFVVPSMTALALFGGLAAGTSGLEPLRTWGLPESGLMRCGLGFVVSSALAYGIVAVGLWSLIGQGKRKFTVQAQYGGMDWPSVVQVGCIVCAVLGAFYGLQSV